MSLELNPVAVTSAPLLRAIATPGWETATDLARHAGRDPKNMARDLTTLRKAGLVSPDGIALTDTALDQLAALDRAQNPVPASDTGGGPTLALHGDLIPDPDQPRKDFTSAQALADLDELRRSILLRGGIIQPIAVRPHPVPTLPVAFVITDGERRWRAVGLAIEQGDWPLDRPLPIALRQTDARETRLTQLTANMIRADMSPLEEADAFADLVDRHAMRTADLADELGVSQKLIQNRLRLRTLDPADRARMLLAEDHPDHLGYKAALKLLTVAREPERASPTDELAHSLAEHGPATRSPSGESGSPPLPATPVSDDLGAATEVTFDDLITAREALIIVELADRIERHRVPDFGDGNYCRITHEPLSGPAARLLKKGLIRFRSTGPDVFATIRQSSTPAGEWLRGLGFADHRDDVLFDVRARTLGPDQARHLASTGRYATAWLNVSEDTAQTIEAAEQPELVAPTEAEREARWAAEREKAAVTRDRDVVQRFSEEILKALADARAGSKPFGEAFDGDGSNLGLDGLTHAALGSIAIAEPGLAGAALALLVTRGGSMGARHRLERLTFPAMGEMMMAARLGQKAPGDEGTAPDPIEDYIQAEVREGEDEHEEAGHDDGRIASHRTAPAVPIRKSIDPDFIICLEDGRKFKSLKRHLRTRYNLSPEQYRARWALPADYPMVAPNYARARADLARQMGLQEPA